MPETQSNRVLQAARQVAINRLVAAAVELRYCRDGIDVWEGTPRGDLCRDSIAPAEANMIEAARTLVRLVDGEDHEG